MTDTGPSEGTEIETTDTSLTIRRSFDAPRDRVYRAFIDPDDIEAWQSIGDLTVRVHEVEAEPGGMFSMSHIPGDDRFVFEGEFLEVVEHERLVYTLQVVEGPFTDAAASRISVEFLDVDAGTEIVFTEERIDPAMLEDTVATWNRMLTRLEGVVDGTTSVHSRVQDLTITRTFDAPRDRVYRAFIDPEELAQWFAPDDLTPIVHELEPEEDGILAVSFLDGTDRTDIEGTYVEVVENERIVHTWNYPDEAESLVTFEFLDAGERTEMVLTHERIGPYRDNCARENADLYEEGWSSALAKLEETLRERDDQ